MNAKLPILIAGGGTGGHLFPGLALADELRKRGASVTFVGTARGLEAKAVPAAGYPLELIDVAGLKGKGALFVLRSLFRLPLSLWQSLRLLSRLRPQVVIGVGGYASGPVVIAAALRGLPTMILEQNSIPGITNRVLGRVVAKVCIAFPGAARFFPKKKLLALGNPIRENVIELGRQKGEGAPPTLPVRVLALGGSQGAHAVNELLFAALAHWISSAPDGKRRLISQLRLRHQSGAADLAPLEQRYRSLGLGTETVQVDAFITDMGRAYADCDLMIGRAGATTLAELTAIGVPALLIPFPHAADDHQTENARWLVSEGAAELLPQATTTAKKLCACLQSLCEDGGHARLTSMAKASRGLGRPEAAQTIADQVESLAGVR
jgi:UDP-N-acetylglucosamine--N-acetylmuramyl-(pentapeptide) pyrophosphoryl-undecaprenol N-acetylglucosamine transferase